MIDGLWDVPAGTHFKLELDNNRYVGATTRWSHENRMGVEFDETITLSTLGEASKFKVQTGWRDGREGEGALSTEPPMEKRSAA